MHITTYILVSSFARIFKFTNVNSIMTL